MLDPYRGTCSLIEKLHRNSLDVVRVELVRRDLRDINSVQCLIVYNIGDEELSVGGLIERGCYQGSNISYNLKQLLKNGYIIQERSPHDRRSMRVKLSKKGLTLRDMLTTMFDAQIKTIHGLGISEAELIATNETLRKLERYWTSLVDYNNISALLENR